MQILLNTTVGDIEIELWTKEAPKACRNFVQLCLEGYYNKTIFHRVVKDFIAQGGDPSGTGHGGESIWGKPFKDEFHSRLRFVRRGLVAMANSGPHDNGSQFFFTLGAAPELNNKHTIFGKVAGNTIYNMIKLGESETDRHERPLHPHKIISTEVLLNPFDDIVPREVEKPTAAENEIQEKDKKRNEAKGTKNFSLLSFGEEAEEEEQEMDKISRATKGKSKSSHDLLDDEKLSSVPAVETNKLKRKHVEDSEIEERTKEAHLDQIHRKLQKQSSEISRKIVIAAEEETDETFEKQSGKVHELREESKRLLKELASSRKSKKDTDDKINDNDTTTAAVNDIILKHKEEQIKYREKTKQKKGGDREQNTLALLAKFQDKLTAANKLRGIVSGEDEEEIGAEEENDKTGETKEEDEAETGVDLGWMCHKLHFNSRDKKVIDANVTDSDRYEIFDPRNPMNKRRREKGNDSKTKKLIKDALD